MRSVAQCFRLVNGPNGYVGRLAIGLLRHSYTLACRDLANYLLLAIHTDAPTLF